MASGELERAVDTLGLKNCKNSHQTSPTHHNPHIFSLWQPIFLKSGNLYCHRLGSWPFEVFLHHMNRPEIVTVNNPIGIAMVIRRQHLTTWSIHIGSDSVPRDLRDSAPPVTTVTRWLRTILKKARCLNPRLRSLSGTLKHHYRHALTVKMIPSVCPLQAHREKQCALLPAVLPKAHVKREGQERGLLPSPGNAITGCMS